MLHRMLSDCATLTGEVFRIIGQVSEGLCRLLSVGHKQQNPHEAGFI